jgi:hypothetical protein
MGTPRFVPARIFANPRDFGRNSLAEPVVDSDLSPVEAAWAWYQHRACLMVFDRLFYRGLSVSDFARGMGADLAWTTRKLHGQTPVSLGDLLEWSMHLGLPVLSPVESVDDLLIPGGVA